MTHYEMALTDSREIRSTGVRLTSLGFGGAPLGNLYRELPDEQAIATVDAAWEVGVRFFDTAPHYGLGLSERRLGRALAQRPRAEYVLSTKVGRLIVPNEAPVATDDEGFAVSGDLRREWDFSRDGVLRSIEESLQRLGTDRIDIVLVHDPDDHEKEALDAAIPTLINLRDQGVINCVGVGMNQSAMLTRFLRQTDIDLVMLAGRYTLLEQDSLDDVLLAASDLERGVITVGVFNSGLLSTDEVPDGARFNYAPASVAILQRARAIAAICADHGVRLPQAAVALPLAHPAVVGLALGMAAPGEVKLNSTLFDAQIPPALWSDLKAAGLLRDDAPTPA